MSAHRLADEDILVSAAVYIDDAGEGAFLDVQRNDVTGNIEIWADDPMRSDRTLVNLRLSPTEASLLADRLAAALES